MCEIQGESPTRLCRLWDVLTPCLPGSPRTLPAYTTGSVLCVLSPRLALSRLPCRPVYLKFHFVSLLFFFRPSTDKPARMNLALCCAPPVTRPPWPRCSLKGLTGINPSSLVCPLFLLPFLPAHSAHDFLLSFLVRYLTASQMLIAVLRVAAFPSKEARSGRLPLTPSCTLVADAALA